MARINLTNHNNQENLGAIASIGVLMCMVVTIVGIKLWWFKQRLSFEPNSDIRNGTAGGATPPVIVPRRNRQAKYKKDKRYSQQIYDSVEVHGVFRKKDEDELEIQRPKQLPPVRIQQMSGSTTSLILPPARTKKSHRNQIHSTAFEDLEIATPTTPILATASSLDLTTIKGSDTKLNLTFEEFEKQFQFKEVNAKIPEPEKIINETTEKPVPPIRLNRSSSALVKPEKSQTHHLKSSQSIAVPEFKKIKERRPADFSRSTEDLTKIDDIEEAKLFETFEERKPIVYNESNGDLQEQYEKELNESLKKLELNAYDPFNDSEDWKNVQEMSALEALKHERIIYHNDINESPDVPTMGNWNFNLKTYQIKRAGDIEFTEEDFENQLNRENGNPYNSVVGPILEYNTVQEQKSAEIAKSVCLYDPYPILDVKDDETISDFHSIKEHRPTKFVKDSTEEDFLHAESKEDSETAIRSISEHIPSKSGMQEDETVSEFRSIKERRPTQFVKNFPEEDFLHVESKEDFETQKSIVEVAKPLENKQPISQSIPSKSEMQKDATVSEFRSVKDRRPTEFAKEFVSEDSEDGTSEFRTVKDRRPTEFFKEFVSENSEEGRSTKFAEYSLEEILPGAQTSINQDDETINEYRSVKEHRPTEFVKDSLNESIESSDKLEYKSLKQSRPIEFLKDMENSIDEGQSTILNTSQLNTYIQNDEIDNWPQFEEEVEMPKVNKRNFNPQDFLPQSSVEDVDDVNDTTKATGKPIISFNVPESNTENNEKFTLNQRRPTGYIRNMPESPDLNETEIWQQETYNHSNYYSQLRSLMTTETVRNSSSYSTTQIEQREVSFPPQTLRNSENEDDNDSPIKHRRPTGFIRKEQYTVSYDEDSDTQDKNIKSEASNQRNNVEIVELQSTKFQFDDEDEEEFEKFNLKQRRPTGFTQSENDKETWGDINLQKHTRYQIRFEDSAHFNAEKEIWDSSLKQRRPTGYINKLEIKDVSDEGEDYFELDNQRTTTSFQQQISINDDEPYEYEFENKEIPLSPTVKFKEMEYKDENSAQDSLIKQRRPTGFVRKEEIDNLETQVNFKLSDKDEHKDKNYQENEAIKQRRPTGFIRKESNLTNDELFRPKKTDNQNKKGDLTFLESSPPVYSPGSNEHSPDFDDKLWREMEKEVDLFNVQNIEEQFTTIRHSYEINEADFLDQKSPITSPQEPLGFGKNIDDDWASFEKLKTSNANKALQSPEEIQIIYAKEEMTTITTTSILKDTKAEEDMQFKPRKSKVTFDFKTEEHLIPGRSNANDLGYNIDDYDDDVYDKPPPPVPPPPQPMQRLTKTNYNNATSLTPLVSTPTKILLFGSQVSQEDNEVDSWSAIRKHRNLTEEFQNSSPEFKTNSPPPKFNTPPPKPSYRNPMAQLAIQRAKEVRADMDGFKARSINDRKPAASKRQRQKIVNLNYDDGTDA